MPSTDQIIQKINNAKSLDFGDIFNNSITLFKKSWLHGFLMQLFLILLMSPFIIMIYIPMIGMMVAEAESGSLSPDFYSTFFAGFSLLYIVFFFVAILVLSAVSLCLYAAFFNILKKLDHNEEVQINDFFMFINGTYLSKAFVLSLASVLISIIAIALCYLPILYVVVPLNFFSIFFAFNFDKSAGDIVNMSFKLGNKKWLLTFGLIIVSSLLASIVGFILCGIGTFFTTAFVYHPIYFIYKEVVGFEEDNDIDFSGLQIEE